MCRPRRFIRNCPTAGRPPWCPAAGTAGNPDLRRGAGHPGRDRHPRAGDPPATGPRLALSGVAHFAVAHAGDTATFEILDADGKPLVAVDCLSRRCPGRRDPSTRPRQLSSFEPGRDRNGFAGFRGIGVPSRCMSPGDGSPRTARWTRCRAAGARWRPRAAGSVARNLPRGSKHRQGANRTDLRGHHREVT